ncbi:MAG: cytochrome c biogenesis heme-transporting ATPase CcmA [Aquirhabdus sp.]
MRTVMRNQALVAKNLTLARGDTELCSQVNFTISSGQILHIQGPNGIGKTTLIMMLAGLIPVSDFDKASILWGDLTPEDWSVLYLGHSVGLNLGLSVRENLRFIQALNSSSLVNWDAALNAVGLSGYEDISVAQLSSGQKRRVGLARLWLTNDTDQLWLLDEPFTALDAVMTRRVSDRLIEYTRSGGRVILTSHQSLSIPVEILDLKQYALRHDADELTSEC